MRSAKPLLKGASHLERILAHFLSEESVDLSDFEVKLKTRWETAFSLLLNWRSREQAVQVLMEQYGISIGTAYNDVNSAISIFGDITQSRKEGWRYILFEQNQKLLQLALKEKNLDVVSKCLDRNFKLAGLDRDDKDFNPEKLQALTINIEVSSDTNKMVDTLLKGGVIDLNGLEAEDIPHEEVSNDQ